MTDDELHKIAAAHQARRARDTSLDMIVELLVDVRQRLANIEKLIVTPDERDEWGCTPAQVASLRKVAADIRRDMGFEGDPQDKR